MIAIARWSRSLKLTILPKRYHGSKSHQHSASGLGFWGCHCYHHAFQVSLCQHLKHGYSSMSWLRYCFGCYSKGRNNNGLNKRNLYFSVPECALSSCRLVRWLHSVRRLGSPCHLLCYISNMGLLSWSEGGCSSTHQDV